MNRRVWIGLAVSLVLLGLSASSVEFDRAWAYIQTINLLYVVPYGALIIAEVLLRALKWQVLLLPIKRCSFWKLNSATLVGLMANNILPARAGEFIRAYAGARLEGVPFSMAFATVVIDRVLDGLTVSAAFLLVLLIQPLPDEIKVAGYGAGALYLAALLVLVGLIVRQGDTLHLLSVVLSPLPARIRHFVLRTTEAFVGGLSVFRSAPLVLLAALISVAIWIGYALGLYLMFLAFGLSLSPLQALVVLLILTIVLTIPASPGFIGTMHAAITFGLRLYGADPSQAFAVAIVYHITQYVPITVSGFVALWLERLSMTELAHATPEK